MNKDKIIEKLKTYTSSEEKIVFAFLFRSLAKGKAGGNNDIDLGLCLSSDYEEDYFHNDCNFYAKMKEEINIKFTKVEKRNLGNSQL
ncbi:MAG: hypothetical protein PHE70_05135 [Tepidanaerobacteraceae bacterium]|nr:hypothetical protein [Tepidanaerobacteraceae bacterium]